MKKRVNIWIDAEVHRLARDLGLNVSRVCERGLQANVDLLLEKNIGSKEVTETKEVKETPKVEQPEQKEVSKPEQQKELEEEKLKEETEPSQWSCPLTGRMGDYRRCDKKKKEQPKECNKECKALTEHWRGVVFGEGAEEEEPEPEPEDQEKLEALQEAPQKPISTTATPIVAPQPQEPSVIEETDIEAQQAAQIKAIRERLEKKPLGQQKLGEE
jgi:hypothetical protein